MSFRAYRDIMSSEVHYAFEGEECRLPVLKADDIDSSLWEFFYDQLPNNPSTIIATTTFMTDFPYLDSMKSMYELDRILNIEAEQDREDKAYQELILQI